jgi:hypothetical protein
MNAVTRRAIIVLFLLVAYALFVAVMYAAVHGTAWLVGKTVVEDAFIVWAALVAPIMCWAGYQGFKDIW